MKIGKCDTDQNVFIIAELSANHNQDFELAMKAVRIAYEAGCDAIKLQTYTPNSLTLDIKEERFKAGDLWSNEYLYDLYQRACMPYEWHAPLKEYADKLGIELFSSPFDRHAVDVCESIDVPAYKIASFEITDIPLIRYAASKGKPIIISTGVGEIEDIELAIQTCKSVGNDQIVLLKCTSAYPAPPESMHLHTIADMKTRFGTEVGLSDHTLGNDALIASVALGARVVEKHFTPDETIDTPDRAFSLSPAQLADMVRSIRNVEKMLGTVKYDDKPRQYARSLYASRDIRSGEPFSEDNVKSIRPGDGLHPKYYDEVLRKTARMDIKAGTPLNKDHFVS